MFRAIRRLLGRRESGPLSHVGEADAARRAPAAAPRPTLAEGLQRGWLELWYQPKFELANIRLAGAEALIRLNHPDCGMLPPASFLPGASEADMLGLTESIIVNALRDWEDFAAGGAAVRLAVNVPAAALVRMPLVHMLRELRPRSDNWPGLILEVAEADIIDDLALANDIAAALRAQNCALAIDDCGPACSSLAGLRDFPFCEIKIDRASVSNVDRDSAKAGVCERLAALGRRFSLVTVAEGIETWRERHALQGVGVAAGQGYLFAEAMSKTRFAAMLQRRLARQQEREAQEAAAVPFGAPA
jgi:EAL domain-containing protein (putative c-di-GMP-specific phosphodiesterase class I)